MRIEVLSTRGFGCRRRKTPAEGPAQLICDSSWRLELYGGKKERFPRRGGEISPPCSRLPLHGLLSPGSIGNLFVEVFRNRYQRIRN